MIRPYLSYGLLIWGCTYTTYLKKLVIQQKKAIRSVFNAEYNSHTTPLFKTTNILKLEDMIVLDTCIFLHNLCHSNMPQPIVDIFDFNKNIHTYQTRQANLPHQSQVNRSLTMRSLYNVSVKNFQKLPNHIKEVNKASLFKSLTQKYLFDTHYHT